MKKILITSLLFIVTFSYSQNFSCGTKGFIPFSANFNRPSIPDPVDPDSTTPYVLNAFFTLIKDSQGYYNIDSTHELDTDAQVEAKFLDCVKILNIRYNPYHIYFKYTGFQIKTTPAFQPPSYFDYNTGWTLLNQYRQENAMNFYFINNISTGEADSAGAIFGGTDSVYTTFALLSSPAAYHESLDRSLVHQVAHNLSLYHTYEIGSHFPDIPGNGPIRYATQCERVNRIPNDNPLIYNADIAGDEVIDTPAQPILLESLFQSSCGPITPTGINCFIEPYSNNVYKNYMNIYNENFNTTCPWEFTTGQITRMRNFIRTNTTNYSYLLDPESVRTDVAQLYEPFDARVIVGDVVSADDQPENGGAWVCRGQKYRLRFQPGFKQIFSDVTNGPITQTEDQQFNYDNGFGQTIGVQIPSISNQVINVGGIEGITSLSCGFEPYTSGTVYSMAVLGTMNITVKELNEIEAKDPELYNKLMQQYYYILKKTTTSGAKTEKTFYKN